jgi:hypothetical protein
MKIGRLLLCLYVFSVLFVACDPSGSLSDEGEGIPLKVASASLAGVTTRSTFSDGVGIYRLSSETYNGTVSNVKYTNVSGSWLAESTPIYLTKSMASFCAYCPYSSAADYEDGVVALTSQLYTDAADLCYQTGVTANSETPASFLLKHAYARMTFSITRDASYPSAGACAISEIQIANSGIKTQTTLNLATGSYGTGTVGSVAFDPGITGIATGATAAASALMVPVEEAMSGEVVLTFTIDGRSVSTALDVSTHGLTQLNPYTNYAVSLTVKGKELAINSVTMANWEEVTVTSGTAMTSGTFVESNCYIVKPGQSVMIPVSRASTANPANFTSTWTAGLLWTDNANGLSASGAISAVSSHVDGGYISVTAGSSAGNGVVWMKNVSGDIVWSWHIWVTEYDPLATFDFLGREVWMDRNLGAIVKADGTAATPFNLSGGLLYQWGRKDPFPGSNGLTIGSVSTNFGAPVYAFSLPAYADAGITVSQTPTDTYIYNTTVGEEPVTYARQLEYSIKYPLLFFRVWGGSTATVYGANTVEGGKDSWGGDGAAAPKSLFDPCPAGWRVPSYKGTDLSPWSEWTSIRTVEITPYAADSWNGGVTGYYPRAGLRGSSAGGLFNVGGSGYYWTATSSSGLYSHALCFVSGGVFPSQNNTRPNAFPVRCVQEW